MYATVRSTPFIGLLAVALVGLPAVAQDDHILIRGAPIAGSSNGLAIDADGRLAVANVWAGTITIIDPADGSVLEVYGRESGLGMPDDVAFAPDGMLYFTQEGPAGGVGRISPDGQVGAVAALPFANPVAVNDDGNLVVAQCFGPENGLYLLDPGGAVAPRLVFGGVPGCALNAFDIGPDGLLYAPDPLQGTLSAVDLDSGETTVILDGLAFPVAVEFDSQGRLHYADQATGAVYRMEASGSPETLAQLEVGLDNLAFDDDDRLYVSNAVDGSITEVLPDGATRVVSPAGMTAPAGVAVAGETLYVAEPQDIRAFDRHTGESAGLLPSVFGVSDLGSPVTVAEDGGQLITTSWFDNTVRVVEWPSGEAVAVYTDFAVPVNALRFQGDLTVAELGTSSIVRASGDDPSRRETLATLVVPGGLAASDDDLYASDWATGMVYQLVADSVTLAEPLVVGSGLAFPEGLAVGPDGTLLVVETGTADLVALDPATGETRVVADGLAVEPPPPEGFPLPPTFWFNGVAVADDGTVYVGGRVDNAIYRYEAGA